MTQRILDGKPPPNGGAAISHYELVLNTPDYARFHQQPKQAPKPQNREQHQQKMYNQNAALNKISRRPQIRYPTIYQANKCERTKQWQYAEKQYQTDSLTKLEGVHREHLI